MSQKSMMYDHPAYINRLCQHGGGQRGNCQVPGIHFHACVLDQRHVFCGGYLDYNRLERNCHSNGNRHRRFDHGSQGIRYFNQHVWPVCSECCARQLRTYPDQRYRYRFFHGRWRRINVGRRHIPSGTRHRCNCGRGNGYRIWH